MKNVTEMTDPKKSPIKANILYITQIQPNSKNNELRIRPIYPQF